MKYLYLLITLSILAACGPSEEEPASEPVNVFEGVYQGEILGFDRTISIEGNLMSPEGEEPCVIEDPYSTTSVLVCEEDGVEERLTLKIEGDTLTMSYEEPFDMEFVFERVSE
tara:strand:- start:620 stop:958 length:339 start_codon:yes stop_codon:yes gene_type:complete